METEFMGKDGFIWAIGCVEDRNDPLYLGRCKVRYLGFHTRDKKELPTSSLPWSFPLMPITSASQTQVGTSPTGPVPGTWVMAFFKDGLDASDPVMMGTLPGRPDKPCDPTDGFNDPRAFIPKPFQIDGKTGELIKGEIDSIDVPQFPLKVEFDKNTGIKITERSDDPTENADKNIFEYDYNFPNIRFLDEPTTPRLARGFKDESAKILNRIRPYSKPASIKVSLDAESPLQLKQDTRVPSTGNIPSGRAPFTFKEPKSFYDAKYPYNHVHQTESGHVIEMDDTPTAERLHWMHRTGSYMEMNPDGSVVHKSNQDHHSCIIRDGFELVGGGKYSSYGLGYELEVSRKGGGEDYWLRVNGTGDVHLEAQEGNVEIYSKGGVTFINAKRIEMNAKEFIKMNSPKIEQSKVPVNDPSLNPSEDGNKNGQNVVVSGDQNVEVGGAQNITAGQIGLSSMGPVAIAGQSKSESVTHGSEETIQGLNVILGQASAGKSTSVQNGIINMRSADAKAGTGGILLQLNELPVSSPSAAKLSAVGYLSITPRDPVAAEIELASTLGSINIKNEAGFIKLADAPTSDITLSPGPAGSITLQSQVGTIAIDPIGLITIKNEQQSLKVILEKIIDILINHKHGYIDSVGAAAVQSNRESLSIMPGPHSPTSVLPDLFEQVAAVNTLFAE